MIEFAGALPSTDNLFKFLFIGGLLMIFTAMIYPMQKRQDIDIELVSYNKEVELINNEIDEIQVEVKKLKELDSKTETTLKKLKSLRDNAQTSNLKKNYSAQFNELKSRYLSEYNSTEKKLSILRVKNIILSFNKNKISILQSHADEYGRYTFWFLIFGIPLVLIGIGGWGYSTYITTFKSNP